MLMCVRLCRLLQQQREEEERLRQQQEEEGSEEEDEEVGLHGVAYRKGSSGVMDSCVVILVL